MSWSIPFVPEQASNFAPGVDLLFYALLAFSFGLGLVLTFLVVRYSARYRAGSRADRSGRRARSLRLEIAWTAATVAIAFGLFAWGAVLFVDRNKAPADAIEIAAIGKQWMWKFRHPGGQREINELHVPVGQPVVVSLASQDVIHSFFVPAFRVKQDAVPGRTTRVWFTATKPGRYHLFCAEYCGTQHSGMRGQVIAMQPERYAAWLEARSGGEPLAAAGERLFRALGCSGCHGAESRIPAPSLEGLYRRPVPLASRRTVIADEAYLRDSILQPQKHVVAGYGAVMPSYDELIDEDELQMIVAYIKSLAEDREP